MVSVRLLADARRGAPCVGPPAGGALYTSSSYKGARPASTAFGAPPPAASVTRAPRPPSGLSDGDRGAMPAVGRGPADRPDELGPGDEIKVFKDEGEDEQEQGASESLQAELLEEKSSLITESEQVTNHHRLSRHF